ncbi:MAG: 50S ribosomal protein L6, partial [Pseudomonadota bacterium]
GHLGADEMTEDGLKISPVEDSRKAQAMWGMNRTMIANIVEGVSKGFTKNLELVGVGYRAQAQGKKLNLQLGYSHEINYDVPEGVEIKTPKPTEIEISGIDKQKVGQTAAVIRGMRPPEPYKGKGVKYADEHIFRKEGKKK